MSARHSGCSNHSCCLVFFGVKPLIEVTGVAVESNGNAFLLQLGRESSLGFIIARNVQPQLFGVTSQSTHPDASNSNEIEAFNHVFTPLHWE